jgi:hypothetical protein
MVRLLPLILFWILFPCTYGQGRYGTLLKDGTISCITTVSGTLYSGIDNYLRVNEDPEIGNGNFYIESTNGYIEKDSTGNFLAIPGRPGKVRYTLYSLDASDTVLLGYSFFNVQRVPDPQLMLNRLVIPSRGVIRKSLLLAADSLSIYISDDLPGSEAWMRVKDFTLGYTYGGFHVSYYNPSSKILEATRQVLYTLGPDREISIQATLETDGKISWNLPVYRLMIY